MKYLAQQLLFPLLVGILFSLGLSLSGMVNPNIVKNFLDILGDWDPRLLYVMGAAVCINLYPFYLLKKKGKTIFGSNIDIPTHQKIDGKLLLGASLFGVGWGITGICPGPAIANLFLFNENLLIFFSAMLFGMLLFKWFVER